MREIEVHLPGQTLLASLPAWVEQVCAAEGLIVSLKGSLAEYPGSVHWHLKKGDEPGTLELTWWPQGERLWFKVAAGREAAWIDDSIGSLRERIEKALSEGTE